MKVRLRKYTKKDIKEMARSVNDESVAETIGPEFPFPYTEKNARSFIKSCEKEYASKKPEEWNLAIEADGKYAGGMCIVKINRNYNNAEVGYWVLKELRGKGIASEALKQATVLAFKKFKFHRIYGLVMIHNLGSAKVLEKAGFKKEGILKDYFRDHKGKYCDAVVYGLVA